jgi:hypothetical protein
MKGAMMDEPIDFIERFYFSHGKIFKISENITNSPLLPLIASALMVTCSIAFTLSLLM